MTEVNKEKINNITYQYAHVQKHFSSTKHVECSCVFPHESMEIIDYMEIQVDIDP